MLPCSNRLISDLKENKNVMETITRVWTIERKLQTIICKKLNASQKLTSKSSEVNA